MVFHLSQVLLAPLSGSLVQHAHDSSEIQRSTIFAVPLESRSRLRLALLPVRHESSLWRATRHLFLRFHRENGDPHRSTNNVQTTILSRPPSDVVLYRRTGPCQMLEIGLGTSIQVMRAKIPCASALEPRVCCADGNRKSRANLSALFLPLGNERRPERMSCRNSRALT